MTRAQIRDLQRDLNAFVKKHKLAEPIRADGRRGAATNGRIRSVKYWLGYERRGIDARVDHRFRVRVRHPDAIRFSSPEMRKRGHVRRVAQRRKRKRSRQIAGMHPGITKRNGVPVAMWLAVVYDWAKRNGWPGRLNSGYRTIAYTISLCIRMCGRPVCPGRCAGPNTNHRFFIRPGGAMDVSLYWLFGNLMRRCPLRPRIFNALGARDPVHFSASGR